MSNDFDPGKDYYKALGVAATATSDEIKKAYRKLAKQCHPDSTGGDKAKEARFKEISNAYDVLGDSDKRKQYDAMRAYGATGSSGGFRGADPFAGFGGMGGMGNMGGMGGMPNMAGFDLGELFAHFGHVSGGRSGPSQGGSQTSGRVRVEHFNDFGDPPRRSAPKSERPEPEAVTTIRASDGSALTVSGVDVSSDVRVPFERAILGTVVTVPTIEGKAEVKIPPGTSSGKRLRLRGKGRSDHSRQGDHFITIHIDVPSDLDDESQNLLAQLVTRLRKRGRDE